MKIALLVLLTAATLPAATIIDLPAGRILPGSYIDIVTQRESASYGFVTEGGFELSGSSWAPSQGGYVIGEELYGYSGFAETLWANPRSGYSFEFTQEAAAIVTADPVVSAPFSLEGMFFDAPTEMPPYYQADFFGSGTVYFSLIQYNFPVEGLRIEVESIRYEFEAAPVPEPAACTMLLLGLGAACWAGKKRR